MLSTILSLTKPSIEQQTAQDIDYEKVKPKMITWNVRRQMLEAEDRKAAQLLADQKRRNEEAKKINEDIGKLEKEVGIEEGVKSDA